MKIFAKLCCEWLAIPCQSPTWTVRDLRKEVLAKYSRITQETVQDQDSYQVRKSSNGALLDPEDEVRAVLSDEDYVSVVLIGESNGEVSLPRGFIEKDLPQEPLKKKATIHLDGNSLVPEDLMKLGTGNYELKLTDHSWEAVESSRRVVDNIVEDNRVVYGITTGFGKFANTVIEKDKLLELQECLVRSHACGVGATLPLHRIRMIFALRINVLAKGYSGISRHTLEKCVAAFNASCLPLVPEQGSVGASGDLAPLAHIALGLMGEGRMWSPRTGWTDARQALQANGLTPVRLQHKEGLALLNGTQFITALGAEAVERAESLCQHADVVAALTLEVLKGTSRAFDSKVHAVRPHSGQILVAKRFRSLLHSNLYPSEIAQSHRFCNKVQDAYTLRCCPQVHGVVNDTVKFVRGIMVSEMNSATDNPLVFSDQKEIISAGNFHGEYPAKALDYLAIAIHELASISERRVERLVNPAYSELPAFLVKEGGLNSGYMVAHVTAAALVSENKTLCHPSSIDSLSTSAGQEDHVSMGAWAARKCLQVIDNVENVLAIELLCAAQGVEFLRPLKSTEPLEAVYRLVRSVSASWDKDRYMGPDLQASKQLLHQDKVWEIVKPYMVEFDSHETIEMRMDSPTAAKSKRKRRSVDFGSTRLPIKSGRKLD